MFLTLFVVFFACWMWAGCCFTSMCPNPRVVGGRCDFVGLPLRARANCRLTNQEPCVG
jgi:hypothetical protein